MLKCGRNRLDRPWVALMAIVGTMWIGDATRACTVADAPKACCSQVETASCGGCCAPIQSAASLAQEMGPAPSSDLRAAPAGMDSRAHFPNSKCECRSGTPNVPRSKPVSEPRDESRSHHRGFEIIAYLDFTARKLLTSGLWPHRPNHGTSKCPVYLRTLHIVV